MINNSLFYSTVHDKMMDLSLTIIAEEAFFLGLPYSFSELDQKEKMALHEYVNVAVEQLGGAKHILRNAMESHQKNDKAKYLYVKKMYDVCTEAASEVAERTTKELKEETPFNKALSEANFTEEEYKNFEKNADKLELEDVGKIVGEKVIATIKSEQEAQTREQELSDKIRELAEDQSGNEEEAEKANESFYKIALSPDDPRHHISLFSKLFEVATESMATLYPEEASSNLCEYTLNDLTFLFSLDSFKREVNALECLERLINLDGVVLNDGQLQEAAMEGLSNGMISKSAFVGAATCYTLLETLNTMNLHTPTKAEVDKFLNTKSDFSNYRNFAIESFMKQSKGIFHHIERDLNQIKDEESIREYRNELGIIENKISNIEVGTEGFAQCKSNILQNINHLYNKIDNKLGKINKEPIKRSASQQVAFEQDLGALNRLYTLYGRRDNVDGIKLIAIDSKTSKEVQVDFLDAMESVMFTRSINLTGKTSDISTRDYVKEIVDGCKFKQNEKKVFFRSKDGVSEKM